MKKGFTLVEMLSVISIAILIAALSFPALRGARQSALRTHSINSLHQIDVALSLYRSSYGGDAVYGEAAKMGLPPDLRALAIAQGLPHALFVSGCPSVRAPTEMNALFTQEWNLGGDPTMGDWPAYSHKYQGNSILIGDDNCDFDNQYANPLLRHRGIGLYEAGHVKTIVKAGSMANFEWWNSPSEAWG